MHSLQGGKVIKKSMISYFYSAFAFSFLGIAISFYFGGLPAALTVAFLTILETSLSFDNAVVNAGILNNWNELWKQRFITWGMIIAVFGVRVLFPMIIVSVAGNIGPIETIQIAIYSPSEYGRILSSAHHQIAAFGATFLLMVFLNFFISAKKTVHWIKFIENPLSKLGKVHAIGSAVTMFLLLTFSAMLNEDLRLEFIVAGIWGIIVFIITHGLGTLLGGDREEEFVKHGAPGFIYLELIDASFSFDGVVGAFALTNNLLYIVLGLGAGAMFVRSFTLLMVNNHTLVRYRYLEHGAFWAIGALAVFMFIGAGRHVPEAVTGLCGAALIAAAFVSSVLANKKESQPTES